MTEVNDDTLRRTIHVARESATRVEAAKLLGIDTSTLRRRMITAASRGLVDRSDWAPTVPEGFHLHRVSTSVNKDAAVAGHCCGAGLDAAGHPLGEVDSQEGHRRVRHRVEQAVNQIGLLRL